MNASESFRPATNYMLISNFSDIMWTIAKRLAMGSGIVVKIYIYIYMGSGVCYALRGPLMTSTNLIDVIPGTRTELRFISRYIL